ncbi:MAG: S9 family peptidase [Parachlamydia sp.]|nr:S9 family peptidase [Parachlamydia sp.]
MKTAPYGQWPSPISADMLCGPTKSNFNCDIAIDGQTIYWTEVRPKERGRTVLMRRGPGQDLSDVTPEGFDIRSKVHEYGGTGYALLGEKLFFVNSKDQRLYRRDTPKTAPTLLTEPNVRFGDLVTCPAGLLAIREDHRTSEVINDLVLIDPDSGRVTVLDAGQDFYAFPTLSPDGSKLAWISWNHPDMPWDSTRLWVADFNGNKIDAKRCVAWAPDESIFQPQWSPQGLLTFVSDRSGWWNLYRLKGDSCENLFPLEAEFGMPLWHLGISTWGFTGRGEEILCSYQQKGSFKLGLLDPETKQLEEIPLPQNDFTQIKTGKGFSAFLVGSSTEPRRLARLDLQTRALTYLDLAEDLSIPKGFLSTPEAIEYPTTDGTAYAFFYPPANESYRGPPGEKPPLMVISHGGPTGNVNGAFNLKIQYWTSRGFAILDVNYRGSTGYGRTYRDKLKGQWGIADVEDCVNGALFLAKHGDVDPGKCVIRGGSAGGYTTLAALAFTKAFRAGASYYGVGDPELLAKDTHKFESRYLDSLIGPYPARRDLYDARSPLKHAANISCPVIFFQGGNDKVVPPNQAEAMVAALTRNKIPTKLILYPEEEHGFRQAETIRDSLEKELQFYLDVL